MKELILKKILQDRTLSYTKLAEMTGISRNSINMMLNGRTPMKEEDLKRILEACNLSKEEFENMEFDKEDLISERSRYKYEGKKMLHYIAKLEMRIKELEKDAKVLTEKNAILEKFLDYVNKKEK